MLRRCLLAAALSLSGLSASAQSQPAPITFSVVSVRPSAPDVRRGTVNLSASGIVLNGSPVDWLLATAFHEYSRDYIFNLPDWAHSTRYDIHAKVDEADAARFGALPHEQQWALLEPMLKERFHLQYHREERPFPTYALHIARGGPHLKPAPENEDTSADLKGRYILEARAVTMKNFADMLSSEVPGQPQDATGLPGRYDIDLHWARMNVSPDGKAPDDVDIFTALRQQLGLEFVKGTMPVSVIVIDHIEKPDAE